MSFEDDMIEEGFANEQDYLDYICSEADARIEKIYPDEESEESPGYLNHIDNKLLHDFRIWKKTDSAEVHFWTILWNHMSLFYDKSHHYTPEQLECLSWENWRNSNLPYADWEKAYDNELSELEKKVFIDTFISYCTEFIEKNRAPYYLKTNNSRLIKMAGISLKNSCYNDRDLDIAIWYSNVNDPSQENVFADYWEYEHKQEWKNWLKVNYSYAKEFLLNNDESLSNLINNIESFKECDEDSKDVLKDVIISVANEQMGDWWNLFAEDINNKYEKAKQLGYDDLFYNTINSSSFESIDPLHGLFEDIQYLMINSQQAKIKTWGRRRPFSHPELKRVRVVLPGAFRGDLISQRVEPEEQILIDGLSKQEFEEENIFSSIDYSQLSDDSEYDVDIEERRKQEEKHQRDLLGDLSPDALIDILPKELHEYYSALPKTDISYKDYEYLGRPPLIFYFCKDQINSNNIDSLLSSYYSYHFHYKSYADSAAFAKYELSYKKFNDWCYHHCLPTFMDYIIKYWSEELFHKNDPSLQIWLRLWRGRMWIESVFGCDKKTKEELFDIWLVHHSKEWREYKSDEMYKYDRNSFRLLWSLFEWIQKGDYQLNDILGLKRNEGVRYYLEKCRQEFDLWLSSICRAYDLSLWKKENAMLIPLFQEHYRKITRLKLWNKAHPDNPVVIRGLND